MKILQVSPFLGEQFGGTERFCSNLSQQLAKRGHEVHVFTARTTPSSPKRENVNGVKIYRFCTPKVVWNVNPFTLMLHKLLSAKYDVIHIHSHLYFSSNQVFLAKILRAPLLTYPPIVLHLHGGLGSPPRRSLAPGRRAIKQWYDRTLGALSMLAADLIIAQSKTIALEAKDQYPSVSRKIAVVLNAIDTTRFHWAERDSAPNHRILFVGDLEYWKGVTVLIKAMRILKELNEDFHLTIVGTGSLAPFIRKISNRLNVELLGQQPHESIPSLMSQSFACVLPSLWEALPTVGLEAMAAGVPFIGTNIGGIPEIVQDGKTGLLIKPNSPRDLAEAIITLKDQKLWRRIRRAAYKLVTSKYDIKIVASRVENIYHHLICA